MMTNVERAQMFVATNYAHPIFSQAERNLAYACYLNGLIAKEYEQLMFDWREMNDCGGLADAEKVLLRIPHKDGFHYGVGNYLANVYEPHISHSLHSFKPSYIQWSKIPNEGWMPKDLVNKHLPKGQALVRWIGDADRMQYRVVYNHGMGIFDDYIGSNAEVLTLE